MLKLKPTSSSILALGGLLLMAWVFTLLLIQLSSGSCSFSVAVGNGINSLKAL